MSKANDLHRLDEEESEERANHLIDGINMSLAIGQKKHNEFVERHKQKSGGTIDGFYKVYCFENDFEDNKRVEEYWNSINPNVNNLYEFKHLTALKHRDRDEIIDILKTEAVTDILIESNLLEHEQFLSLIKLGKSIYYEFLGSYMRSVTFIVSDVDSFAKEINEMLEMYGDESSREGFYLLCKKVEVRLVEHFDKSTQVVLHKLEK